MYGKYNDVFAAILRENLITRLSCFLASWIDVNLLYAPMLLPAFLIHNATAYKKTYDLMTALSVSEACVIHSKIFFKRKHVLNSSYKTD